MGESKINDRKYRIAATIAFFSEAIRFIVLPLVILYFIMMNFPILSSDDIFERTANNLIIFGGLIAMFAALEAYFSIGSPLKMIFGILAIATLCAWFWFLFSGESIRMPFGALTISVNIVGLLMVILVVVALKGLLPIAQFIIARKELRMKASATPVAAMSPGPPRRANYHYPPPSAPPGRDESLPPPPDDFTIRCPICSLKISLKDDVCPHCGAWIRQKMK